MRSSSLERAEPWWGSLGASLLLHGALVGGLLVSLLRPPAAVREAPDLWQGDLVTVDTLSDGPPGGATPAAAAMAPAMPVQGTETVTPAEAVPVALVMSPSEKHSATQKQIETTKHKETVQQSVQQKAVPRTAAKSPPKPKDEKKEPRDPNEALLAKVMGFQPSAGNESEAPANAEPGAAPNAVAGGSRSEVTVRNLPKAFTRALANAAAGDADRYSKLPAGKLEEFVVTIEVDERGDVATHSLNREASARMKDLVRRTLASLGAGQFALRETQVSAGTLQLEIEIRLSGSVEGSPRVTGIGYEPPWPGHEGKAYFVVDSGRRFEAKVKQLR